MTIRSFFRYGIAVAVLLAVGWSVIQVLESTQMARVAFNQSSQQGHK